MEGFQVAAKPVTIGDYRDFVISVKGYSEAKYWEASHYDLIGSKQSCPSNWTLTVCLQ